MTKTPRHTRTRSHHASRRRITSAVASPPSSSSSPPVRVPRRRRDDRVRDATVRIVSDGSSTGMWRSIESTTVAAAAFRNSASISPSSSSSSSSIVLTSIVLTSRSAGREPARDANRRGDPVGFVRCRRRGMPKVNTGVAPGTPGESAREPSDRRRRSLRRFACFFRRFISSSLLASASRTGSRSVYASTETPASNLSFGNHRGRILARMCRPAVCRARPPAGTSADWTSSSTATGSSSRSPPAMEPRHPIATSGHACTRTCDRRKSPPAPSFSALLAPAARDDPDDPDCDDPSPRAPPSGASAFAMGPFPKSRMPPPRIVRVSRIIGAPRTRSRYGARPSEVSHHGRRR